MACATKSTSYNNHHSVINSISDLGLIVKLLLEDIIFNYQPGKKSNKSKFINLYIRGSKSISIEDLLELYQNRVTRELKVKIIIRL